MAELVSGLELIETGKLLTDGIKGIGEIAKRLRDLGGSRTIKAEIEELNTIQGEALSSCVSMVMLQSRLQESVRQLSEQLVEIEGWQKQRSRYELRADSTMSAFYMLKESERGSEPEHRLCTNCFEDRKKSIMQPEHGATPPGRIQGFYWACPRCHLRCGC